MSSLKLTFEFIWGHYIPSIKYQVSHSSSSSSSSHAANTDFRDSLAFRPYHLKGSIRERHLWVRLINRVGRVSANGPGDLGSIPNCVIPKTLKTVLDTSLLNTQQYKVRIKGKVEQSRKRSSAPPTLRCSSYWKGSLLVTLDYSRQLYFLLLVSPAVSHMSCLSNFNFFQDG